MTVGFFKKDIHFQYNGMIQGIFLISVYFMENSNFLLSSLFFAIALNFKHIYMYVVKLILFMAPIYFFYLLKNYVFGKVDAFSRLFWLILTVGFVFGVSFGPIYLSSDSQFSAISQIFSRLFPTKRGLVHNVWAPNFWAIYMFLDRFVEFLGNLH